MLIKQLPKYFDRVPNRIAMFFLTVVIPIHLFVLVLYIQHSRTTQRQARRDAAIQQVMNVTHMVQATPIPQLERALAALDQSKLRVQVEDEPRYELRSDNPAFWIINRLVPKNALSLQLSIHLLTGKWLNIDTDILGVSLWPQLFLLIIEVVFASIILFYVWSLDRFIKPLKDFQQAAERLGVDIHSTRFKEYSGGPAVVRETAQAMNRMQKRIKDLLDNRNTMLAAISHDLRTPITRLKLRLSKSDDSLLNEQATGDLDEMEQMISEILAFASNDHSEEGKSWIDLNAFVQTICDELVDMEWSVNYNGHSKRVPVYVRKIALKRALSNVIHNAIKYGKHANVMLNVVYGKPVIYVDDDGPGIEESELEFVFAPFYRCDRSRSRKIAGTGLGLAVARDAIRSNSGEIYIENRPQGGLRVKVVF